MSSHVHFAVFAGGCSLTVFSGAIQTTDGSVPALAAAMYLSTVWTFANWPSCLTGVAN